jgi:transposase
MTLKKKFIELYTPIKEKNQYPNIELYCCDESRFGLHTYVGSVLAARGVKPKCHFQQVFKSKWVYGGFSPFSGNSLVMTFDECKSTYFQIFLDELSRTYPDTLMVLLLDNAKFHTCKGLIIPQNIKFIFQPPYSPELNPSEKVWWTMKRSFRNKSYKTLDEVEEFIKNETASLTTEAIKQICGYSYFWG